MRVLYFITKSENGGAQSVLYELAKSHKERGDTVAFMAQPYGWLETHIKELGFEFFPNSYLKNSINPFRLYRATKLYKQAVDAFKPDVISCHSSIAGFIGRVSLNNRYPIVFTARGWAFTDGVPWWRKIIGRVAEKYAANYCAKIICVSEFDRQLALKYKIASPDKFITIHNGVDVLGYHAIPQAKKEITIVFNGRMAIPKNQKQLVYAFAKLSPTTQAKSRLLFVGGGPEQGELEDLIESFGLISKVSITGEIARETALQAMSTADIFVLLSNWEGYPVSIAEGLQIGLPILASNVGGVSEMVDDTVGTLLPRGENNDLLIEKLELLINDDDVRIRLAQQAYANGNAYTKKDMSKTVFDLYDHVIQRKNENLPSLTKIQKAFKNGIGNIIIGQCKKLALSVLQLFYRFDSWHAKRPVETTNYKKMIVRIVNKDIHMSSVVVDVGCGLGDILRRVKSTNRIGIDVDAEALRCAQMLNMFTEPPITYHTGSLEKVADLQTSVDMLIITNWLHVKTDEWVSHQLEGLFKKSTIKYCIVDEFPHQRGRIKKLFEPYGSVDAIEDDWQDHKRIYIFKIKEN